MLKAATVLMEVTASEATASACVSAERSLCCAPAEKGEGACDGMCMRAGGVASGLLRTTTLQEP